MFEKAILFHTIIHIIIIIMNKINIHTCTVCVICSDDYPIYQFHPTHNVAEIYNYLQLIISFVFSFLMIEDG